jgi:hypothetical protein
MVKNRKKERFVLVHLTYCFFLLLLCILSLLELEMSIMYGRKRKRTYIHTSMADNILEKRIENERYYHYPDCNKCEQQQQQFGSQRTPFMIVMTRKKKFCHLSTSIIVINLHSHVYINISQVLSLLNLYRDRRNINKRAFSFYLKWQIKRSVGGWS